MIGVYDYLLEYHKQYYNDKLKGKTEIDKRSEDFGNTYFKDGAWMLSLKLKQDILLNNIYGVDIDHQAVEVTQLSLFLKMLEDETLSSTQVRQGSMFSKVLPDLSKNIICGNSLIGWDIMDGQLFENEELKKLNPMDYEAAFPTIMRNGGFDAIVGNPPYGAEILPISKNYLTKKFSNGNLDTAALFMLYANILSKEGGYVGYIIPKSFTYASNWSKTRDKLLPDLFEIIDCSKVWKEVKLEMSIYFSSKNTNSRKFKSVIRNGEEFINVGLIDKAACKQFDFILNGISAEQLKVGMKIRGVGYNFPNYFTNQRGGMFQSKISDEGEFDIWGGKQIGRYLIKNDSKGKIDSKLLNDHKAFIKDDSILVQNIVAHITKPYPQILIIASIPDSNRRVVILDTVNQLINISNLNSKALLGIINSKLIGWYTYKFIYANAIRTMHFDTTSTNKIPLPLINLTNLKEKKHHDKLVDCVLQMLEAKKQTPKTDRDKQFLENQISSLDRQIDNLVYKLYDLTEEEIKIVEGC